MDAQVGKTPPASSAIHAIAALTGGDLRVWSFIVTILGDMVRAPGQEISGVVLSAMTQAVGIKPQAQRVALHRLRKDGWIDSRREGRGAFHFLTDEGRAQAEQAAARIYAFDPPRVTDWHLAIAAPMAQADRSRMETQMGAQGYVPVVSGTWLGTGPAPETPDFLTLTGTTLSVPAWVSTGLMPDRLMADYAEFETLLWRVSRTLGGNPALSVLDTAVLRALIVHSWRRLVLRHPVLPEALYPAHWRGPTCRDLVRSLLTQLGQPALDCVKL